MIIVDNNTSTQLLENQPLQLEKLFDGWKMGTLLPAVVFAIVFAIHAMVNRIAVGYRKKHIAYQVLETVFVMGGLAWLLFFALPTTAGSVMISYCAVAFVMTAAVCILNFMSLPPLDYTVLFACFICVVRFAATWRFGMALEVLFVFIAVLTICKIGFGRLRGRLFYCWFASMFVSAERYISGFLFRYVRRVGYSFDSQVEKLFVWGAATLLVIIANLAVIYAIKRLFGILSTT